MSVDAVLDTNVLLYAASKDPADRPKAAVGLHLLGTVNLGVPLHYDGVKVVNPFKGAVRAQAVHDARRPG